MYFEHTHTHTHTHTHARTHTHTRLRLFKSHKNNSHPHLSKHNTANGNNRYGEKNSSGFKPSTSTNVVYDVNRSNVQVSKQVNAKDYEVMNSANLTGDPNAQNDLYYFRNVNNTVCR